MYRAPRNYLDRQESKPAKSVRTAQRTWSAGRTARRTLSTIAVRRYFLIFPCLTANLDAHTVQDLAIEHIFLVPLSFHEAGESPKGSRV